MIFFDACAMWGISPSIETRAPDVTGGPVESHISTVGNPGVSSTLRQWPGPWPRGTGQQPPKGGEYESENH